MPSNKIFSLAALMAAAATMVSASPMPNPFLQPRQSCVEGTERICYGVSGGESQGIDVEELEFLATYLRFIGESNTGINAFWTMDRSATGCQEWALPLPEGATIMVLAKHVTPFVKSSVLYGDIASTIDGGVDATEEQRSTALLGCATNGGQMGVAVDKANPAYQSSEYKDSKARSDGIVIKVVKMP